MRPSAPTLGTLFLETLANQINPVGLLGKQEEGFALAGASLAWEDWLRRYFPEVTYAPFAERHVRLWNWIESLQRGVKARARIEVWPRGGAKSSTAELGCARVGSKLSRKFGLYVSETQEQADKHIQSIAALFETVGVGRMLNKYGASKGWRRDQLRTHNGFSIAAFGLDAATRGVKLDQYRPDLIIFDDIDNQADSRVIVDRKVSAITTAILPAGSADVAVLVIQNKIHEDSIVSQLCDGRADFLHDRDPAFVEPAVNGMETEVVNRPDGSRIYQIVAGTATWDGQSIEVCEDQINEWGFKAFEKEAQHNVEIVEGFIFNAEQFNYCTVQPNGRIYHEVELYGGPLTFVGNPPAGTEGASTVEKQCRAWDLAATEGGGDCTASVHMGIGSHGRVYVFDVTNEQWAPDKVVLEIERHAIQDGSPYPVKLRIPQDPAQAGKSQKTQFLVKFARFRPIIRLVTGSKVTRASTFAEEVNRGNVWLVRAPWNQDYRKQLRKFRENVAKQQDDMVDASSDAYNTIATRSENRVRRVSGYRRKRYAYA